MQHIPHAENVLLCPARPATYPCSLPPSIASLLFDFVLVLVLAIIVFVSSQSQIFAASNRRHNNFVAIAYLCSQREEGGVGLQGKQNREEKRIRANFWACYPFFYWFWFRSVLLTFVRQQFDFFVPFLCLAPSLPEYLGLLRLGLAVGKTS